MQGENVCEGWLWFKMSCSDESQGCCREGEHGEARVTEPFPLSLYWWITDLCKVSFVKQHPDDFVQSQLSDLSFLLGMGKTCRSIM